LLGVSLPTRHFGGDPARHPPGPAIGTAAPSAGGSAAPEAEAEEVGISGHHQRSVSALEGRGGTGGAGPRIGAAVNLKAVVHA